MQYEKKFVEAQAARTDPLNRAVCLILILAEGGRQIGYRVSCRLDGQPSAPGYLRFFLAAAVCALLFWVLNRYVCRRTVPRYVLQFTGLTAALLWSCLYSVFEVRRGEAGTPFPQILLLTSAGIRSPGVFHVGVNIAAWALYAVLLGYSRVNAGTLVRELVNSGIYLLISCVIITATYRFQYHSYQMEEEARRVRAAELDLMAEQVERAQQTAQTVMNLHHDLRHYAWEVRRGLECGDDAAIRAVTDRFIDRLNPSQPLDGVRSYTGAPACDAILSRFAGWAQSRGVPCRIELTPPRSVPVQDFNLVLMNALENAARAVAAQEEGAARSLRVLSGSARGQYFLEVANTFPPGSVSFGEDGLPVSRRAGTGHGYGTRSMASVLRQYGVLFRFQADGGLFRFQFMLPEDQA